MKKIILFIFCILSYFVSFSQTEELFQMKKPETKKLSIDKTYTSDSYIPIDNISSVSSLSISGKIRLNDYPSLVRVILITEEHEYLVLEAFPLICDKTEFSFNKYCDETFLINDEKPLELIIVVTNAEIELKDIHFSDVKLADNEKSIYSALKHSNKEKTEKYKTSKINQNNYKKNKNWIAGVTEMSLASFEEKKMLLNADNNFLSGGFEYYVDGIFSLEDFDPERNSALKSVTTSNYVSEFDWRNRHGQNWNTSVKNQTYNCGACYAFATVAATEAMMNIYYNNPNIDLDLSEQEIVSCDTNTNGCGGGNPQWAISYIKYSGIVDENCFPYTATDEDCTEKCSSPDDTTHITGFSSVYSWWGFDELKKTLINKGPLASWMSYPNSGHAMQLSGYSTIEVGDTIRYLNGNDYVIDSVIQTGNSLIGQTYWIFKNSYGTGSANGGYMYLFNNETFNSVYIYGNPVGYPYSTVNYERNYTDNDHDGYFVWGLGPKPDVDELECAPNQQDGDDSNPYIGPMDTYGNCTAISSPYTPPSREITSTETWQGTITECGDIVVKNGGNLTINGATINLKVDTEFSVETGGILTFNSGVIQ